MDKRYKVTFEIQGEWLEDEERLNKENLKTTLVKEFNSKDKFDDKDTEIENIEIEKIKTIYRNFLHF